MAVTTGDIRGGSRDRAHLVGDPAEVERGRVVRVAAIAAGERAGWPVPQGLLDRIVAETLSLRQSPADLERMATAIVERAKQDSINGTGPRAWDAVNAEANRYFRVVFGQVIFGQGWLSATQATRDADSGSSADYDVLSAASGDYSSPAGIARMRDHAHRHGVGWMANHTELLRLGPAAIELFARTNFQRGSYEQLRQAGFEPRQAETLVRYAERNGHDANVVARTTADSVRIFGGNDPAERERWRTMFDRFHTSPDNAESREGLRNSLQHMEREGTPEQREQARRQLPLMERMGQAVTADAVTTVQADRTVVAAASTRAEDDNLLADLNGAPATPTPGAGTPPPRQTPPTPHVAGPR